MSRNHSIYCQRGSAHYNFRHGGACGKKSRTYQAWLSMKRRCYNARCPNYARWGGRGITVCDRWRQSFTNFLADMGRCPDGYSLDRIDNDGNYEPSNCRWATREQQMRNNRRNRLLTHDGRTQCLAAWSKEVGIRFLTLYYRLKRGWSVAETLTKPVQHQRRP
jgi:hypothetical protein